MSVKPLTPPEYPGAVAPDRERTLVSLGLKLRLFEWGSADAPPLVLTHGFFDHSRAFDCLAPLLADHFRVVSWDARGHGDSEHAHAYTWPVDVMDQIHVLRDVGPCPVVAHSRGGGLATDAACLVPELVTHLVLLDGFGPPPEGVASEGYQRERPPLHEGFGQYLDWRRATGRMTTFRPRPTLEDLAVSRQRQNPRLSIEWMRYFAYHGATQDENGWRWKVDPLAARGFGAFDPSWVDHSLATLEMPVLALEPGEHDVWALPEPHRTTRLSRVPDLQRQVIADAGHFMAIEQPRAVADATLRFVGAAR